MLRLNVCCSLIPGSKQINLGRGGYESWIIKYPQKPFAKFTVKAVRDESDGGRSSFSGQKWDPGAEIEVPFEQRPVNEYSSLKDGPLYSWGELGPQQFLLRVGGLCLVTFTVLGVPVAAISAGSNAIISSM